MSFIRLNPKSKESFNIAQAIEADREPDTIVLYRSGDFYECTDDSAILLSQITGIETVRVHGLTRILDMAGFPVIALKRYLPLLLSAGITVYVQK